jgi:methylenetetrahydrofolate dehydrogenase (NADP+)/methenyltetrahydrofolate cyclohydrolase
MVRLIDGKALAEKIKDDLIKEIIKLKGEQPNLAIIIVGERADSALYVGLKEKEGEKVGIDIHTYKCSVDTSEREIFEMIKFLNADEKIDGILVQLPLPEGFDTDGIIMAIDPSKDLDGFHPNNLERLFNSCDHEQYIPPLIKVVLEIIKSINYDLQWKKVCIIANSDVFGRSLAWVLKCKNAHTDTTNLGDPFFAEKMNVADVVISAIGKPRFIKKDMIKEGAVLIDIGITKVENKVFGDVDYEDVKEKAGYITPVPGGVGPMTIAMTFKNALELYKRRHKK